MQLKILSFNILAEQFIDYSDLSADYSGVKSNLLKLKFRLPLILSVIKKISADIVFLQEINLTSYVFFKVHLKEYKFTKLGRNNSPEANEKGNAYGNVTLINKKLLIKHANSQQVHAPMSGNVFLLTEFQLNDKWFLLVNLHLDCDDKETIRKLEVKFLLKLIKKIVVKKSNSPDDQKTTKQVIILAGDFNTSSQSTHKLFKQFTPAVSQYTGTYLADSPMIDWIYIFGAKLLTGKVLKSKKLSANPSAPLLLHGSDHYPIFCKLKI